jgi:hypothetical protein
MKTHLLAPVAVLICAAVLLAQYPVSIALSPSAPSGQVQPGSTVNIPLNMSATTPPAGLQFSVTQPPEIAALSVQAGAAATAAGKSIACATSSNVTTCIITGVNQLTMANGVVANILATVSATTPSLGTTINFSNALGVSLAGDGQGVSPVPGATFQIAQAAPVTVSSLSCAPTSLLSGATATCTVTLSGAATIATPVSLSSSNQVLSVPTSITIAAGGASGTFTATAGTITVAASSTITASIAGSSTTATIGLTPPTISKCDLNGDFKTDATDVAIAQTQVLGTQPCTSADLNGDGKCTVVDLQNVIEAAQGQACRVVF